MQKEMEPKKYEIKLYSPDLLPQVAEIMRFLWSNDHEANLSHFQWKHIDNPYTEHPLGIVALHNGKVVGFRAYFATNWQIGNKKNEFILLSPGDTCVHPDHRRKGLSVIMGLQAMEEFESKYKIFLNITSSQRSLPGYLKLGFFPLAPKYPLTIYGKRKERKGLVPKKLKRQITKSIMLFKLHPTSGHPRKSVTKKGDIEFGEYGNIIVSENPRPEEMSNVVNNPIQESHKIRLLQDETFFRWRFLSKRKKYIFFYYKKNDSIKGYLVVGIQPDNIRQGAILDYAENSKEALERILEYIIKSGRFETLAIQRFGLSHSFLQILEQLGLDKRVISQTKKWDKAEKLHLLVRPVKKSLSEKDWFLENFDIRDIDNWDIKPICSDAA